MLQKSPKDITRRGAIAALSAVFADKALALTSKRSHLEHANRARAFLNDGVKELRLLAPEGSLANLEAITSRFRDLSGISVNVSFAGTREIGTTILTSALLGHQSYDIALPPTYEIPDLVAAGAIQAFDPIAAKRLPEHSEDKPLYSSGDIFNGQTYGSQTDGDVYLMFLNRDILTNETLNGKYSDAFGAAFATPKSWAELDRQIAFVSKSLDRPGAVLFREIGQIEWEFWLRLHGKGIWPLSQDFNPQFDSAPGLEALEDMIAVAPFVASGIRGNRSFGAGWQSFVDDGAYATFGWGGTQKIFRSKDYAKRANIVAAPIPGGQGDETPDILPYFNWGWSYALTKNARHPEMALAFVRFAISSEVSTVAIRESDGFFDPFLSDHYQDPEIRDIYGISFLKVHEASLSNAIPDFYIADRKAYFDTLGAWLKHALDGSIEPRIALKKASDHWRLLANDDERSRQADRWRQLRETYPPNISRKLRDIQ